MRKLIILILTLAALTAPVLAAELQAEQGTLFGADGLRDGLTGQAAELMEDYDPLEQADFSAGVVQILADAAGQSGSAVKSAAAAMLKILVILVLGQTVDALGQERTGQITVMAAALGITACCASDLHTMIGLGQTTMEEISNFSGLLLPVMAAAATATGAAVSAGAMYTVAAFFSNLLIRFSRYLLIPLVYAYIGLAMADGALGQDKLSKMRELLGWVIRNGLKAVMYLFTGFLTVTGLLSGSADAAALKAAKAAISTAVPVVGGIISGAAETILASAGLLRSAIGTFGMLAVLSYFILPFFKIGISYLAFKVTAALGGMVDNRHGALLEAIASAMGFLLAMTGSCAVMSLLSCCCFFKAVQP